MDVMLLLAGILMLIAAEIALNTAAFMEFCSQRKLSPAVKHSRCSIDYSLRIIFQ